MYPASNLQLLLLGSRQLYLPSESNNIIIFPKTLSLSTSSQALSTIVYTKYSTKIWCFKSFKNLSKTIFTKIPFPISTYIVSNTLFLMLNFIFPLIHSSTKNDFFTIKEKSLNFLFSSYLSLLYSSNLVSHSLPKPRIVRQCPMIRSSWLPSVLLVMRFGFQIHPSHPRAFWMFENYGIRRDPNQYQNL